MNPTPPPAVTAAQKEAESRKEVKADLRRVGYRACTCGKWCTTTAATPATLLRRTGWELDCLYAESVLAKVSR